MQQSIAPKTYKKNNLSPRDSEIKATLFKLKYELDCLHNSFDTVTDPILIDSFIYEIMSVNMKYTFYLKLCKERGLYSDSSLN